MCHTFCFRGCYYNRWYVMHISMTKPHQHWHFHSIFHALLLTHPAVFTSSPLKTLQGDCHNRYTQSIHLMAMNNAIWCAHSQIIKWVYDAVMNSNQTLDSVNFDESNLVFFAPHIPFLRISSKWAKSTCDAFMRLRFF